MQYNPDKFLKEGKIPLVFFIFGYEEFLIDEFYQNILKEIVPKYSDLYDTEILNLDTADLDRVLDSLISYPFASEYRTVIVRNFEKLFPATKGKKADDFQRLVNYLNSPQETTRFIILANDEKLDSLVNPSSKASSSKSNYEKLPFPYNILIGNFDWVAFPKIYEKDYIDWIIKRFSRADRKISPEACELLISHVTPNLRNISSEIEKLVSHSKPGNQISFEDIESIVGISRTNNIFELQKAIGKKEIAKSLNILRNMLSNERQEMLIITMLTRYFIILWKLLDETNKGKDQYQLASSLGVSAYFLNDYKDALKYFSPQEIDNAFVFLTQTDEKLKSTGTDSIILMEQMLIRIISNR